LDLPDLEDSINESQALFEDLNLKNQSSLEETGNRYVNSLNEIVASAACREKTEQQVTPKAKSSWLDSLKRSLKRIVKKSEKKKRKVYDCCQFLSENDLLEIRINQHWDVVDKFIVVESTQTHSGLEKPLNLDIARFAKYSEKLIYVPLCSLDRMCEIYPSLSDDSFHSVVYHKDKEAEQVWKRNSIQGNYYLKILNDLGACDDDIVFASTLDEILHVDSFKEGIDIVDSSGDDNKPQSPEDHLPPLKIQNWSTLADLRTSAILGFKLQWYLCKVNFKIDKTTAMGVLTKYSTYKKISSVMVRHMALATHVPMGTNENPAGCHFYFFDPTLNGEGVKEKFNCWPHYKDDITGMRQDPSTAHNFDLVQSLFQKWPPHLIEVTKETHPKYLVDNLNKYQHLLGTQE